MSGQPNNSNTVASIQWDPAVTAFGTDRLRALVAARSHYDVQVTAVVSLQALYYVMFMEPVVEEEHIKSIRQGYLFQILLIFCDQY